MKYMLLLYSNGSEAPKYTPEEYKAANQTWQAVAQAATAAGALLSSHGLASVANATTVRIRDGKTLTVDGPFAETHEQLGGAWLFECQNLDEAIKWAAKIPTANWGSVEIRPLWGAQ